jgi:hypothetical protein
MPGNDRQSCRDLSFDDVEIRPADAARFDRDRDLCRDGSRIRQLRGAKRTLLRRPDSLEEHRFHRALFCGGMSIG